MLITDQINRINEESFFFNYDLKISFTITSVGPLRFGGNICLTDTAERSRLEENIFTRFGSFVLQDGWLKGILQTIISASTTVSLATVFFSRIDKTGKRPFESAGACIESGVTISRGN